MRNVSLFIGALRNRGFICHIKYSKAGALLSIRQVAFGSPPSTQGTNWTRPVRSTIYSIYRSSRSILYRRSSAFTTNLTRLDASLCASAHDGLALLGWSCIGDACNAACGASWLKSYAFHAKCAGRSAARTLASSGTVSSLMRARNPRPMPRLLERLFMQIPLQISFENAEPSEAVRAAIRHEVDRLEKYQHHIIGCRVAVVAPSTKQRHGAVYRINIWVTIPPHKNIVVSHQPSDKPSHVHELRSRSRTRSRPRDTKSRLWANAQTAKSSSMRSKLMVEFQGFLQTTASLRHRMDARSTSIVTA